MAGMSGGNVTKAVFINLEGGGPFQVQYNPTAFQYDKAVNWQPQESQGSSGPPLEFQKNSPASVSMDLLFDTTNEGGDVREKWVNGILHLTNPMVAPTSGEAGQLAKKRPPKVCFMWSSFKFTGVIASANVTYLMFASSGTPVRAKVNVKMTEWEPEEWYNPASGGMAAGSGKVQLITLRPGETVSALAIRMGVSTSSLCSDNNIDDPMNVAAGTSLVVRR
jgi:hypothetical protein